MKRFAPFLIIALVAVLTLVVGKTLLRANARALATQPKNPTTTEKNSSPPVHARGPENAPVTLEEFGDFQCPACAETASVIRSVEQVYGKKLRLIFWEFPLAMHAHGREAAIAAEAAAHQGHFWEMHDKLFAHQVIWAHSTDVSADFEAFALELHFNMTRFREDLQSPVIAARVDAQRTYGVSRGVKNTPTLFINGREFPPPFTSEALHDAIDAILAAKKK